MIDESKLFVLGKTTLGSSDGLLGKTLYSRKHKAMIYLNGTWCQYIPYIKDDISSNLTKYKTIIYK